MTTFLSDSEHPHDVKEPPKSARRRAREFVLQGLYQWRVGGADEAAVEAQIPDLEGFAKADRDFFVATLRGVIGQQEALTTLVTKHIDRPFRELSPIEACVLLMGACELANNPETPYRVIINEAIELTKAFGGTDGHKYVNGVLDKVAAEVRPVEVEAKKKGALMAGEFALIDKYFARATPSAILGPGDDCALLQPTPGKQLAITTDMLVAGTHFLPDTNPEKLGWKALAVNLSDLAAMGATPRWALLAGSLPAVDEEWIASFSNGFFACASEYGVDVVGGDTTRGPLNVCITALGECEPGQALRRDGARAGDLIWVSGRPGLASLGLAQLQGRIELREPWRRLCVAALERPRPRVALGLALVGIASAAIDVSDGLLADLGHIGERSGLAAAVQLVQLPQLRDLAGSGETYDADLRRLALECQLAGGDDYELCFTTPPAQANAVSAIAARLELPLWCIGSMGAGKVGNVTVFDPDGNPVEFSRRGYDHFA